jgi:hypothetical protein
VKSIDLSENQQHIQALTNKKQKTTNKKQKTKNKKQQTKNNKQKTKNKKQRTTNKEQTTPTPCNKTHKNWQNYVFEYIK